MDLEIIVFEESWTVRPSNWHVDEAFSNWTSLYLDLAAQPRMNFWTAMAALTISRVDTSRLLTQSLLCLCLIQILVAFWISITSLRSLTNLCRSIMNFTYLPRFSAWLHLSAWLTKQKSMWVTKQNLQGFIQMNWRIEVGTTSKILNRDTTEF